MSGKTNPTTRRLAASIVKFLQDSQKNGTLDTDDAESMEVATTIIAESFGLDTSPVTETANLLQVFDVYEKTRERMNQDTPAPSNEATIAEAERLKGLGNAAVQRRDYTAAIDHYTEALALTPDNKIYLSNRAAAYSQSGQHNLAASDALRAVEIDPGYAKAWSRLGHARFALGDAKGSMEAYEKGLSCEGGQTEVMNRGYQTAARKYREMSSDQESTQARATSPSASATPPAGGMPDLSSLLGSLGGAGRGGGGGGSGGGPDLGGLLNNPMLMNMAQQMASSGAFNDIMNNPRMRDMAQQMMSGERNIGDIMNDPEVQNMARNFGAGRGGGQGGNTGS